MRLFGRVNSAIDRDDRGPWMLNPFTIAWAYTGTSIYRPAALLMGI